jgi:protocatechuate 3,4-dioxygenase beta subunit
MMRTAVAAMAALLLAPPGLSQQAGIVFGTTGGGLNPQAPARDNVQKTGTARIRGHVYAADSGTPLRRAQVRLFAPELREQRATSTDERGAYEFKDLPGGRFNLTASKGSYVSLQYGQTRPMQGGTPLELLDGQAVEKVDFALPRGAVITGRVLDEFGEPIADAQVAPVQSRFMQGRRRMMPVGRSSQTNDIGEYRVFGLSPGEYYVSATIRNFSFGGDSDDHNGYAPTYYPGTANGAEAQRVTVQVGQSLSEINITLVATRTAKITGTVVDSQGRPVLLGSVVAMPRGTGGVFFGPMGGGPIRDGSFTLSGVAPGEYTLRANLNNPTDANGRPEFATAIVTVNGEDINGVRLGATPLVPISGRVVVLDAAAAQSLKLPLQIQFSPVNPDDQMFMPGGGATITEDFTFQSRVAPGKFRVFTGGSLPGWTVHAVRQNGRDVTDAGVEISGSAETGAIEIELTNHLSEVSGVVTNQRGEAAKDYTVLVFSQDREQWEGNTRYRSQGRPDQDGRFKIRALPAGSYYGIALESVDPGDSFDPDFLERLRMKATMFSLGDGEAKSLDLKLQSGA